MDGFAWQRIATGPVIRRLKNFVTRRRPRFIYYGTASTFVPIMRFLPALLLCFGASLPAAAISASATGSTAGAGRPSVQAGAIGSIKAAEAQRAQAVAKRDVNALRRLIGGEYYHVETNGRVRSRTEFLQQVGRDEYEFESYAVDDMEVRAAEDGRSAVVTGARWRAPAPTAARSNGAAATYGSGCATGTAGAIPCTRAPRSAATPWRRPPRSKSLPGSASGFQAQAAARKTHQLLLFSKIQLSGSRFVACYQLDLLYCRPTY
jgi:hypothetical protein